MLWAIDVGNTHTVVGLKDDGWSAVWRLATDVRATEDQLAASLAQLCQTRGVPFAASAVIVGTVVPSVKATWAHFCEKWLKVPAVFLENGAQVGLEVTYDPPMAVGADRIANALAGIASYGSPVIVVDFGTATTFDTVDAQGRYVGGAILPGVLVSMEALSQRAAKLPPVSLEKPAAAIGRNTVDALRSGVMLGYAGAIDALAMQIKSELGGNPKTVATGGLAPAFADLCQSIDVVNPTLTLEGLVLAHQKLCLRP